MTDDQFERLLSVLENIEENLSLIHGEMYRETSKGSALSIADILEGISEELELMRS